MATADQRLYFLTIHQAGELMRRGELSPVELTRACLDRIADTDDRLHSFILLLADEALNRPASRSRRCCAANTAARCTVSPLP